MGFLKKLLRRLTGRGKGGGGAQEKDGRGGLQSAIGNQRTRKAVQQQLVPQAWPQGTPGNRVLLGNRHSGEEQVGGDSTLDRVWGNRTAYAKTEQEQSRYLMGTARADDGRTLLTGSNGSLLDTSQSTMPVGMSREGGRNIFAMGADGKMRSLDVGSEFNRINPKGFDFFGDISDDAARVHHTTMTAGQDVAAAGEIEVDQGQLRMMSNRSGHYLPPAAALHQAVSQLDRAGVELGGVGMQILGGSGERDRTDHKGMRSIPALQFLAHAPEMEEARARASDPNISLFERNYILNQPMDAIRADRARNAGFFAAAAAAARRKGLGDPNEPSEEKDPEPEPAVTSPARPAETIFYNDPGTLRTKAPAASETFYNLDEKDGAPTSETDTGAVPAPTPTSVGEDQKSDGEEISEEEAAALVEEVKYRFSDI